MNKFLFASLIVASAPAAAAGPSFLITPVSNTSRVSSNNEYQGALAAVGLTDIAHGAGVAVSGRGSVTYTYVGSESGLVDSFTDGTAGPFSETNGGVGAFDPIIQRPFAPVTIGSKTYATAGALTASFLSGTGDTITPGSVRFGVFAPASGGASFSASTIYFSVDDRLGGDGDFDDFIVKATISDVPEPAAWILMIAGFGLVGAASRQRRTTVVTA